MIPVEVVHPDVLVKLAGMHLPIPRTSRFWYFRIGRLSRAES